MTGVYRHALKTLAPAPEVGTPGIPQRITTEDIIVRHVTIESHRQNAGEIYVALSQTDMISLREHTLYEPGDTIELGSDPYGNMNAEINLRDLWFDGQISGDSLIVSYMEIGGSFQT